jgi:hypothetical protein
MIPAGTNPGAFFERTRGGDGSGGSPVLVGCRAGVTSTQHLGQG